MIRIAALIWLLALSACGADGEPVTPTVAGEVSLSDSGITSQGAVGLTRGAVTVGVGF